MEVDASDFSSLRVGQNGDQGSCIQNLFCVMSNQDQIYENDLLQNNVYCISPLRSKSQATTTMD